MNVPELEKVLTDAKGFSESCETISKTVNLIAYCCRMIDLCDEQINRNSPFSERVGETRKMFVNIRKTQATHLLNMIHPMKVRLDHIETIHGCYVK